MKILTGEMLLIFGVFYFCIILLAARNPDNESWWVSPRLQVSLHLAVILCSWSFGPMFIGYGILDIGTSMEAAGQVLVFLALMSCMVFFIKKMRIGKRLAEYDAMTISKHKELRGVD